MTSNDHTACTDRAALDEAHLRAGIAAAVGDLRATRPMVGSITNAVSMEFVANAQLATGSTAAMVYLADEAQALARIGGALYINMGTLMPVHAESIPLAARTAHEEGRPWVLDPVGIGIGDLRERALAELRAYRPTVVRGNATEIIALARLWNLLGEQAADEASDRAAKNRVVEATDAVASAQEAAVAIARWTGGAVAVSGPTDLVTNGHSVAFLSGGSPLMERVTGFGCSLGGVVAGYAAVAEPFIAACAATAHYNAAGARAAAAANGPASFKTAFIDELYQLSANDVAANPLTLEEV